jgi:hypothetical protein
MFWRLKTREQDKAEYYALFDNLAYVYRRGDWSYWTDSSGRQYIKFKNSERLPVEQGCRAKCIETHIKDSPLRW